MPSRPKHPVLPPYSPAPATEGCGFMVYPFRKEEYMKGVSVLNNNKVARRKDVFVEQLKNPRPKVHRWLLTMLNKCFMENKIPTVMYPI